MRFFLLGILFILGCKETHTLSPKELQEKTISILNVQADKWDGTPNYQFDAVDAWGTPLVADYDVRKYTIYLTLRSCGPDKLPKNSDDIAIKREKDIERPQNPPAKPIEKSVEDISHAAGKGLFSGIIEGLKKK